jgi:hypothetical protein
MRGSRNAEGDGEREDHAERDAKNGPQQSILPSEALFAAELFDLIAGHHTKTIETQHRQCHELATPCIGN